MRDRALAFASMLACLGGAGCSFAFMTKVPDPVAAPDRAVECTASRFAPVLDAVCAGAITFDAVLLAGHPDCNHASPGAACYRNRTAAMLTDAGLAALCVASSVSGFGRAQRCRAVRLQNALCVGGDDEACRVLSPGWRPAPTAPGPAPAAPGAAPAQREDGLLEGTPCTATWQCRIGLACQAGQCAPP
jgi:hypothetical protein